MPRHKIFHTGHGLVWRRRRGHHALKSHKRRQHQRQPFYHCMCRFTNRHYPQFFEIAQIDSRSAAEQHCSLALQLALHGRGNIDGRQRFLEDLSG